MNITTRANPATPVITLDENGFVVSALGEFDRYKLNSATFVEASGLTAVSAGDNDTLTVETRNCGDANTWTFCSDIMSVGPALYVPAPEAATLTWDPTDYLLEVDFDATHIKIETGKVSGGFTYIPETTYTAAEFAAAYPDGIWCNPSSTYTSLLIDCWLDVEVWNTSGSYSSLAVPSARFTINEAAYVVNPPFTFNFDVETGEVLSVVPSVTPNNVDIIVDLEVNDWSVPGSTITPGPFTCENDWTCPAAFSNVVGNSYPDGVTIEFLNESWTDGSNDVHIPNTRSQTVTVRKTNPPTTSFGTLTAGLHGISQPYDGTPADQNYTKPGTHKFEYSVDGGITWVSLPDVAGGTISTNLNVGYDVLNPGNVPVPSLDFRARYCADNKYANDLFVCSDWSTVKSYTQADLTADNPDELVLEKHTSWSTGGGTLVTTGTVADTTQYRVDTGAWTTTSFGSVNTPGLYQTRQQNCGMAAGGCSSGGTNVFPSEWVESELEITKAPTPTVTLTPGVNPGHGGTLNTCLELHVNGESVQWYQAAYGGASYSLDGGSTTTPVSWTGACYGVFADGDEVIAYARDYAGFTDGTYDLASDETASPPYTVTKADDPEVTVDVDPLTGATTLSSPTGSDVTLSYAVNGHTYTDYTTGDSFTVAADDVLRIKAYNCPAGKALCGFTYETITITQAGTVPAAWLYFDVTGGSNDFAFMHLGSDPNYILTSFKVNSVEYVTEPVACVAEPSGFDPNTCLTNLDTTLGFGELMSGDSLEYTLYKLGDGHLAGAASTNSMTLAAHITESPGNNLAFDTAETTADGFTQMLSGGRQVVLGSTFYGAFQYSTDGTNWTALPTVSTTTSSLADFVAEVPNSAFGDNENPISDLHIRFRSCFSQSSNGYTFNLISSSYGLCKNWQTTNYTQGDLTPDAPAAPALAWNNSTQTIDITNPADDVQYSTDGTNWTDTAFGTITTPGTYYVRHRTCGTANDVTCATGGMNVYPSAWETSTFTVSQDEIPTVTITMDDAGELVVTTDATTTEIQYGFGIGPYTNVYTGSISGFTYGDTLTVSARAKDGTHLWSAWTPTQTFETMGTTVSSAATTAPNSDWTQLSFTSTGNDIEYKVLSSFDSTGVTGDVWTEGTSATIRTGDLAHSSISFQTAGTIQLAEVSTRTRDCINVNVEASCTAWVEELNITYGSEHMEALSGGTSGYDDVTGANGEIAFRGVFRCNYDRCMPISSVRWYYDVDTDPAPSSNSWAQTDTFQNDRLDGVTYVTPISTSNTWTTEGEFIAKTGIGVLDGAATNVFGTTTVADSTGTVDLPVATERIKRIYFSARWVATPADTYGTAVNWGSRDFDATFCWDAGCP